MSNQKIKKKSKKLSDITRLRLSLLDNFIKNVKEQPIFNNVIDLNDLLEITPSNKPGNQND
jgi:hypothetical protein